MGWWGYWKIIFLVFESPGMLGSLMRDTLSGPELNGGGKFAESGCYN